MNGYVDPRVEVRRWRKERAGVEAIWLVKIRARLREGNASTRQLADACAIAAGREFGRFRHLLNKCGCVAKAGETTGPTGHLNIVWATDDTTHRLSTGSAEVDAEQAATGACS